MHKFDQRNYTWGAELEWGDVSRKIELPSELGSWEYSEVGVLNLRAPYALRAVDPLGIDPPVGGEINTMPSKTRQGQVDTILALKKLFTDAGCPPTVSNINGLHFHVCVPGLTGDIEALRKLAAYNKRNQKLLFSETYDFHRDPDMRWSHTATQRLGQRVREIPDWMSDNLQNAVDFEDFIRIQCCGKDGVSRGRPLRFGFNMYCLKHIGTIEVRCLGATVDDQEMSDSLEICGRYIEAALTDGPELDEILGEKEWHFAKFNYRRYEYEAWEKTRWPDERGTKVRKFVDIA